MDIEFLLLLLIVYADVHMVCAGSPEAKVLNKNGRDKGPEVPSKNDSPPQTSQACSSPCARARCPGGTMCVEDLNACTARCVSNRCRDGSRPVNCFVDPCDPRINPCSWGQTCRSNYCGGCNAICSWGAESNGTIEDKSKPDNKQPSKTSKAEKGHDKVKEPQLPSKTDSAPPAGTKQTCAFPPCAATTCSLNTFCVEDLVTCTARCVSNRCPDGSRPVNCFVDPCDPRINPCRRRQTCRSNYCGGCNAICSRRVGSNSESDMLAIDTDGKSNDAADDSRQGH